MLARMGNGFAALGLTGLLAEQAAPRREKEARSKKRSCS